MNTATGSPLNLPMIRRLVLKDWHFMRWPIAGYLGAGGLALVLLSTGGEGSFYAGSILLFTVLISLGIHLAMATVVEERTGQTLPFIMSLPISPADYTTAKILANLLIFVLPWGALLAGTIGVIAGRETVENGLIPFVIILLTSILVSYCLLLAVALVSESQAWTIGAIVFGNLAFQATLYGVSHTPSIAAAMKGDVVVWTPAALAIVGAEVAAIVLLLAGTFFLQNRKTDFI